MLAPGRPSTNRLRARENAVRASSWRCTSASVGSTSARRISSEKAGALAPHLPEAGVGVQLRDPPLGPFQQVAQRLHPRHQPRVEDQRRASPARVPPLPVRSPACRLPRPASPPPRARAGGVGGGGWWDGAGADVVGEGPVRQEGGAAEGAQLARVEAAEGGGEEGGEELVGPGRVEGEAEQVQHMPDDRLGHELTLPRAQPVRDAEPLEGPAGGPAEPSRRRQQDGHPAVGDAVPFVGDPQEAGVRLGLLGGAGVAGGLQGGAPTPGEGDDRTGSGRLQPAHGVEPGAAEPPAALEQHDAGAVAAAQAGSAPGMAPRKASVVPAGSPARMALVPPPASSESSRSWAGSSSWASSTRIVPTWATVAARMSGRSSSRSPAWRMRPAWSTESCRARCSP